MNLQYVSESRPPGGFTFPVNVDILVFVCAGKKKKVFVASALFCQVFERFGIKSVRPLLPHPGAKKKAVTKTRNTASLGDIIVLVHNERFIGWLIYLVHINDFRIVIRVLFFSLSIT
jgi:hypothetical protein